MKLKPQQTSLRTLFFAISIVAVFLSWRSWNPDRVAESKITAAGGVVYLQYQQPKVSDPPCSSDYELIGDIRVRRAYYDCDVPRRSFSITDFLIGAKREQRIAAVRIPSENVTQEILDLLKNLEYLKFVFLETHGDHRRKSLAGKRYLQLRDALCERLFPREWGKNPPRRQKPPVAR